MRRTAVLSAVLCLGLLGSNAMAEGLGAMTPEERAAFGAEVKAYLLENPEVLVEAMGILQAREYDAETARDAEIIVANSDALFASPGDWVGGNPEGDITLVEFMDYRCSYCRKAHDEVQALVEGDGNIRYIIKEFPILGPESLVPSQFAIAVRMLHGDDAYKAAHDALMKLRGEPTIETLERLAADLGHDPQPLMAKMQTEEVKAIITANHELADVMAISGTPAFVLKNTLLRGYVPLEGMQAIVAEERSAG